MTLFRFVFSKTFVINMLIALVVVVAAFIGVSSYLTGYTLHGESIEVPSFENYKLDQLDDVFKRSQLNYVIVDSIYLKEKPAGTVIEQDPAEGRLVKKGRKVYLTVTAVKPPQTTIPDLIDRSMRQAEATLAAYGLKLGTVSYESDPCSNCVLKQQQKGNDLTPGNPIHKGAVIDLVVGKGLGDELVPIPYLYHMNAEMAKVLLKTSLLTIGAEEFDETVITSEDTANAIIYRQIPAYAADKSINSGSLVSIFLTMDKNKVLDSSVDTSETIQP
jgi:beta-lactam-binding protein with PASTA domain